MFAKRTNRNLVTLLAAIVLAVFHVQAYADSVWTLLTTDGPSPRSYSAMVYDSCRDVSVLFGGLEDNVQPALGDTWEWDGNTWDLRATTGPTPRNTHAMAFDESRCVTVLFGGYSNDTWEWDGNTWTERCSSCPPPRRDASNMTYDSRRGVMLLFGGWSGGGMLGDLWKWDGVSWEEVTTTSPRPSSRMAVGLAYDASRDRTVLFGGAPNSGPGVRDDETWELDMSTTPATWQLIPTSVQPAPRSQMRMVYDSTRSVMVVFGGIGCPTSSCTFFGDTWEWDGSTWTEVFETGPSPRWTHATAYDAARQEVVLFGGRITDNDPDDVSVGDTWSFGECRGPAPAQVTPEPAVADIGFGTRMRYLSFLGGTPSASEAVRVQFDVDGVTRTMYVGQPFEVSESSQDAGSTPPTFWAAPLQCDPLFTDWSLYPAIHAFDESVVPSSVYDLSLVASSCQANEAAYSPPLTIATSRWGDVAKETYAEGVPCSVSASAYMDCWNPPDGDADFDDITSVVDKFRNLPGAPAKSRVDVAPEVLDFQVDFTDIPAVVDGFRGLPYPYPGPPTIDPCGP